MCVLGWEEHYALRLRCFSVKEWVWSTNRFSFVYFINSETLYVDVSI